MAGVDEVVGGNIKRLRKEHGFTQEHIAQFLGIDQTLVSKVENGQRSIGVSALEALCDLFFCSLDDLIGESASVSQKAVAFRSEGLGGKDLESIAAVGRIARNLEEMATLEKAAEYGA